MNYKDLRYDNWVKGHLTGKYLQVDWLVMKHMADGNIQSVYTPDIPVYEPIPLTPEILVKAGFEEIYKSSMHTTFYKDKVSYYFWHQTAMQYADFMGNQYDNIQNVHQLQNLIHSLTGEELNIEL